MPRFSRRVMVRCAHGLGWLAYYLLPRERRIARVNLDTAFGDTKTVAEKRRIVRVSVQDFAATLLGLLWSPRLTRSLVEEIVEFDPESLRRVREIQARGKGVISIAMHYGDWELLGLALGFYGLPMTVVQDTTENAALGETLGRLRAASGHRMIPSHRAAAKLTHPPEQPPGWMVSGRNDGFLTPESPSCSVWSARRRAKYAGWKATPASVGPAQPRTSAAV